MKKKYLNLMAYAMIVSMSAFTLSACDDDDDNKDSGNEGNNGNHDEMTEIVIDPGKTLSGVVESGTRVVLSAGESFMLSGGYTVEAGGELKIEEGVKITAIEDDQADFILIKQGGKIDAQGTAENPIVMTSQLQEPKGWGGIHICGYAPSNKGTGSSEIGEAAYGGNKADDNSGILRYIRLEYTGFAFDSEHESNGVSFYGVGNGTTVEYLQAYKGADDGFEFFGGTVDAKYLVVTGCEDDSFDWTEGWSGRGQFWVATQEGTSGLEDEAGNVFGDCLIEADNHSSNAIATPISCPTLSNLTLIGNGSEAGDRGIRLRAGTYAKIYNAIVTGKGRCLTVETPETENSLVDGKSVLNYISLASDIDCKEGIYSSDLFMAEENHNAIKADIKLNGLVGTIEGGADLSSDSFFEKAECRGAIEEGNNWTAGWTK